MHKTDNAFGEPYNDLVTTIQTAFIGTQVNNHAVQLLPRSVRPDARV